MVTSERVFTVLILTFYLRLVSIYLLNHAIHSVSELWVAIVRIQVSPICLQMCVCCVCMCVCLRVHVFEYLYVWLRSIITGGARIL